MKKQLILCLLSLVLFFGFGTTFAAASQAEPNEATASQAEPDGVTASQAEPNGVTASQAEPNEATASQAEPNEVTASQAEPNEATASQAEPNGVTASQAEPNEVTASQAEEAAREENILDTLYRTLKAESDKVFSLLAFSASALVLFFCRRGILPLLKNGLNALCDASGKLAKETQNSRNEAEKITENVNNSVQIIQSLLENMEDHLKKTEEDLTKLSQQERKNQKTEQVLMAQVDMLTEVFMASSLPQYRKELVGEKLLQMKESLAAPPDAEEV